MQEFNPGARPAVPIAGRSGVSPIGTTSPNTGAAGNTGSSYASGAFASGVNIQGTATAYTVQDTDYQGLILFNTAAAVTVTLNYAVGDNFTTTILNIGSGKITLLPNYPPADPGSALYTVNGGVSLTLASGSGCVVAFADRLWYAYVGTTIIPSGVLTATRGGTILNPSVAINVIVWYAAYACTVTHVLGYVSGATGSVINARRNGTLSLLVSNLTLGSADTWMDGGAVQNAAISIGDKLEIMVISVSGAPTEIAVEIQCTIP